MEIWVPKGTSQSPQAGQFNSYSIPNSCIGNDLPLSQSPQAGQFNSYGSDNYYSSKTLEESQSPQAGQFNSYKDWAVRLWPAIEESQSPQAGQFNSYEKEIPEQKFSRVSQSPQAGQFNSYIDRFYITSNFNSNVSIPSSGSIQFLRLKLMERPAIPLSVSIPSSGSIQFLQSRSQYHSLLWRPESQSPQAGQFNSYLALERATEKITGLNPLKRVNSILTG